MNRLDKSVHFLGQGSIELEEAHGQANLIACQQQLPTLCDTVSKTALEAHGVVFGEQLANDPLFTHVTLPKGWKICPTNHPMHSDLVDGKGRKRAEIFYKAAFYDRRAWVRAVSMYKAESDYTERSRIIAHVTDYDGTVFYTVDKGEVSDSPYILRGECENECMAWLDEHFPDLRNPSAYWGET